MLANHGKDSNGGCKIFHDIPRWLVELFEKDSSGFLHSRVVVV